MRSPLLSGRWLVSAWLACCWMAQPAPMARAQGIEDDAGFLVGEDQREDERQRRSLRGKLRSLVLPEVALENVTLDQAVDFLREQSRAADPAGKGINFLLEGSTGGKEPRIDRLTLSNTPVGFVLEEIARVTNHSVLVRPHAVLLKPVDATSELETRVFQVPADFLSRAGGGDVLARPLREWESDSPTQRVLSEAGLLFPEVAWAFFNPAEATLTVINTPHNLEKITEFVRRVSLAPVRTVTVRAELYQLPPDAALRLLTTVEAKADATGELEALRGQAAAAGPAKFVAAPVVQASHGQWGRLLRRASFPASAGTTRSASQGDAPSRNADNLPANGDGEIFAARAIVDGNGTSLHVEARLCWEAATPGNRLSSTMTLEDGQTRLWGTLASSAEDSVVTVVFLSAAVVK